MRATLCSLLLVVSAGVRYVRADDYIVTLDPTVAQRSTVADAGTVIVPLDEGDDTVLHVTTSRSQAELLSIPGVVAVEPDQIVYIDDPLSADPADETASTSVGSWGIDRIDGKKNGRFDKSPFDGQGVTVFVVDTGVFAGHDDFTGRVARGVDFTRPGKRRGDYDCHGHGTHVASTAAGKLYGVATGARVVPVKVLGCTGSGTRSGVIAGINWVVAHKAKKKVLSMSLGGRRSSALNAAVNRASMAGVAVSVAAGNDSRDACWASPASATGVLTVASTTAKRDVRSYFSNYGKCVDMFAPGSNIVGAAIGSRSASQELSGTSMACPHVSGVLATLMQQYPEKGVTDLYKQMRDWAERGSVRYPGNKSPNLFLRNWRVTPTPQPTRPTHEPTPRPTALPTVRTECRAVTEYFVCRSRADCRWKNGGCSDVCTRACHLGRTKCKRSHACKWSDNKCSPKCSPSKRKGGV